MVTGPDQGSLSDLEVRVTVRGLMSLARGHWSEVTGQSRVTGQRSLVTGQVRGQESLVKGHAQGSLVRGQKSLVSVTGQRSLVFGQSQGSLVNGQRSLVSGQGPLVIDFQGSWVMIHWLRVMIRSHCQRSGSLVRG